MEQVSVVSATAAVAPNTIIKARTKILRMLTSHVGEFQENIPQRLKPQNKIRHLRHG
jgi:hypothetical protein